MKPSVFLVSVRALLGVVMLFVSYLVLLTSVALYAGLVVLLVKAPPDDFSRLLLTVVFSTPVIGTVLLSLYAAGRPAQDPEGSVEVTPEEEPALWNTVHELAGRLGVRPPTRLYLILQANAMVLEHATLLGLLGGTRRLYVGMPLLVGLTRDELEAVICHELGHYAGRHTALSSVTRRGATALESILERLGRHPMVQDENLYHPAYTWYVLFSGYARLYTRLTSAIGRRQEFEADRMSAQVVGAVVMADALRSAHSLALAWTRLLCDYLEPVAGAGWLPDDPFAVFAQMLAAPEYQDTLRRWRNSPPTRPASRFDRHPPLAQRLDALAAVDAHADAAAPACVPVPAIEVLTDPDQRAAELSLMLLPQFAGDPDTTWLATAAWASTAAATLTGESAQALARAAGRSGRTTRPSLQTVLEALAKAPETLAPARALPGALRALLYQVLVRDGLATGWRLSWVGQSRAVADQALLSELHELTETVDAQRLEALLRTLPVDLTAPLLVRRPAAQEEAPPAEPEEEFGLPPELEPYGGPEDDEPLRWEHPVLKAGITLIVLVIVLGSTLAAVYG
ncbi:M48 family metalloprotease [Kitasatospora sp. NPDC059648]|uniref:M48 family metalloprotease n=1 Tax=Kitasatospora sp. NPDC059648 TaxID=3346894 RepID=UPI0036829BCA